MILKCNLTVLLQSLLFSVCHRQSIDGGQCLSSVSLLGYLCGFLSVSSSVHCYNKVIYVNVQWDESAKVHVNEQAVSISL